MKKRKIFAWDLDGTLTIKEKSGGGWTPESCLMAKPRQEMINLCNQAWKAGHFILIYTARRWTTREATVYWLQKNNVHYHALDMGSKPLVDHYIDDRAINAEDLQKIKTVL